jgi:hypothetical protein
MEEAGATPSHSESANPPALPAAATGAAALGGVGAVGLGGSPRYGLIGTEIKPERERLGFSSVVNGSPPMGQQQSHKQQEQQLGTGVSTMIGCANSSKVSSPQNRLLQQVGWCRQLEILASVSC